MASESPEAVGEYVLTTTVARTNDLWGDRLVAAYAPGSLAHGGFSINASDVDLGLILSDPVTDRDGEVTSPKRLSNGVARHRSPEIPLLKESSKTGFCLYIQFSSTTTNRVSGNTAGLT